MLLSIFSYAYLTFVYLLWWSICSTVLPTYLLVSFFLLTFVRFIYFGYNPSSDMWLSHIFFAVGGLSFNSLNSLFGRTEFFNFEEVWYINSFIYGFDFAFDVIYKKSSPNLGSQEFSLTFFRSFIVLAFIFRYVIHFEITFAYGVIYGSHFMFVCADIQLSQHHLLKRLSFHHCSLFKDQLIVFVWIYLTKVQFFSIFWDNHCVGMAFFVFYFIYMVYSINWY